MENEAPRPVGGPSFSRTSSPMVILLLALALLAVAGFGYAVGRMSSDNGKAVNDALLKAAQRDLKSLSDANGNLNSKILDMQNALNEACADYSFDSKFCPKKKPRSAN
jgi:hypothetical protein